jgi:mannose-6-phosphate isomerase-like protein (cupin superfamily)
MTHCIPFSRLHKQGGVGQNRWVKARNVILGLQKKYPGKKIIKDSDNNPTEIVCEVEPTSEHHGHSLAVAVIDKSKPHYHKKTVEEYKVVNGVLNLYVGEKIVTLKKGDKYTIEPNIVHWAEGNETWVECKSKPG